MFMLVGLSLGPPPVVLLDPRNDGIGLDSLRIRLAALLFEKARLTCVPPARTGVVIGAALDWVFVLVLAVEDADEDGRLEDWTRR